MQHNKYKLSIVDIHIHTDNQQFLNFCFRLLRPFSSLFIPSRCQKWKWHRSRPNDCNNQNIEDMCWPNNWWPIETYSTKCYFMDSPLDNVHPALFPFHPTQKYILEFLERNQTLKKVKWNVALRSKVCVQVRKVFDATQSAYKQACVRRADE